MAIRPNVARLAAGRRYYAPKLAERLVKASILARFIWSAKRDVISDVRIAFAWQ